MDEKMKIVRSEEEFKKWFEKNFRKLGYTKIIKDNKGKFPDFIMQKNNKRIGVELETRLSHFILHKHNIKRVNDIVCIEKDIKIKAKIKKVKGIKFIPKIKRISATIEKETLEIINKLVRSGRYRNKSHVIEEAIKLFEEKK